MSIAAELGGGRCFGWPGLCRVDVDIDVGEGRDRRGGFVGRLGRFSGLVREGVDGLAVGQVEAGGVGRGGFFGRVEGVAIAFFGREGCVRGVVREGGRWRDVGFGDELVRQGLVGQGFSDGGRCVGGQEVVEVEEIFVGRCGDVGGASRRGFDGGYCGGLDGRGVFLGLFFKNEDGRLGGSLDSGCRRGRQGEGVGGFGVLGDAAFQRVEGVLAVAATHAPAPGLQLLGANPEGRGTGGAACEDHGVTGRSPSRRTQPSCVAPTVSAMKGA